MHPGREAGDRQRDRHPPRLRLARQEVRTLCRGQTRPALRGATPARVAVGDEVGQLDDPWDRHARARRELRRHGDTSGATRRRGRLPPKAPVTAGWFGLMLQPRDLAKLAYLHSTTPAGTAARSSPPRASRSRPPTTSPTRCTTAATYGGSTAPTAMRSWPASMATRRRHPRQGPRRRGHGARAGNRRCNRGDALAA